MSNKAKPSYAHHAVTLLAFAGVAAAVSGDALQREIPQPAAAVAAGKPVPAPVAVAPEPVAAPAPAAVQPAAAQPVATQPVAEAAAAEAAPVTLAPTRQVASVPLDFATLRARVRWLSVPVNGRMVRTPDSDSRLLLARSAAEHARLAEVGLDFRDVYGVITAETSWVPRTGMGRNGVASQGLAQLEPATARALGVRDANDAVEAVHGAAKLLKEAGAWSARRIAGLGLSGAEYAARLREGISVYYNLSSRARQRWNGLAHTLPVETRRHITNVRAGIEQAERLDTGTGPSAESLAEAAAATARISGPAPQPVRVERRVPARHAAHAAPHPVGTIAWSGRGNRSGTHVVWSNGAVTREGARVHWSSNGRG
jgi:hypothetical protein